MKPISRRVFLRSAGLGALSASGAGVLGRYTVQWLELNEYTFHLPRWTKAGFKVAFLSDTHLVNDNAVAITRDAVSYAIAAKPNVIIFGGDFVESSRTGSMDRMEEAFEQIRNCGIPAVCVLGNHDYAAYHPERVVTNAQNLGFHLLRNESIEVDGVTLFGLDCLCFGRTKPEVVLNSDVHENLLVVLHEPDGVDLLPDKVSLMMAGHSHGGQICLPTGLPIMTPTWAKKYRKGFYEDSPVPLFVSRGLGETGVRLRLFCRPEASILHLEPAAQA